LTVTYSIADELNEEKINIEKVHEGKPRCVIYY